jgi:heterodisulfide reductase subunit A
MLTDMVVLSIGMTPPETNAWLADRFGVARNPAGFLSADPEHARNPGIFPAGSALQPMGIAESIADGSRAAAQAVQWLNSGSETR